MRQLRCRRRNGHLYIPLLKRQINHAVNPKIPRPWGPVTCLSPKPSALIANVMKNPERLCYSMVVYIGDWYTPRFPSDSAKDSLRCTCLIIWIPTMHLHTYKINAHLFKSKLRSKCYASKFIMQVHAWRLTIFSQLSVGGRLEPGQGLYHLCDNWRVMAFGDIEDQNTSSRKRFLVRPRECVVKLHEIKLPVCGASYMALCGLDHDACLVVKGLRQPVIV